MTFEQIRLEFYERLRQERAILADLQTALEAAVVRPGAVLEELATFAHRLRGAAAIFGEQGLRDAAEELEGAAGASRQPPEGPTLGAVRSALARLLDLLSATIESAAK